VWITLPADMVVSNILNEKKKKKLAAQRQMIFSLHSLSGCLMFLVRGQAMKRYFFMPVVGWV